MNEFESRQKTGSGSSDFRTTQWSIVLAAGNADPKDARDALEWLARSYWQPLYSYLRRRGCDGEEARDLTQGFFARLLERQDLKSLSPQGGRFRSFLLTAVKNYFLNEREKTFAKKRGGNQTTVPLELPDAEKRYEHEPFHEATPEKAYEKVWARSVLGKALERLADGISEEESRRFTALKSRMLNPSDESLAELAASLSMTPGAAKVALHRLRQRFARCLREEVAATVSSPEEIEDELRHLLESLLG